MNIGVLSMQGDVREHMRMLSHVGATALEVKRTAQLDGLGGLIIPGGESTTIGKLMVEYGFVDAVRQRHADGMAVWGTCAGEIVMARRLVPEAHQPLLELMDITVRRNSFGRQVDSFEEDLEIQVLGDGPFHAVFIRAPWIESVDSDEVEVLATVGEHAVMARQGRLLATSFHPEMTGDTRVHEYFLREVCGP